MSSPLARTLRSLMRSPQFVVSVTILITVLGIVLLGPVVTPFDPWASDGKMRFCPPSTVHWLGCDEFGRDIFANIAQGGRISLIVSTCSMLVASSLGICLGLVAGYARGVIELLIMRCVDILLSFPPMLMAIFLVALTGPSVINLILVIGVLYVPRFARIAHSSTLVVSESPHIESARAIGAPVSNILFRHILPNVMAPLIVQFSLGLGSAILVESGLSFLGLGPPPPEASWGRMISKARRFLSLSPYGVLWPSIVISMTVLAFNLLGDVLRDRLDPRLKGQMHAR